MTEKFPGEWIDEMAEVPPEAWQQPDALRLADALDSMTIENVRFGVMDGAAAELRRLHSVNAQLLDALDEIAINTHDDIAERVARAAIAAAKELL